VIHYHGTPITPNEACYTVLRNRHGFVSFRRADQLAVAIEVCQSFAIDNGAFSAWKSGSPVTDWTPFYDWVDEISRVPHCDFAVVPDVIDGGLADQERLMDAFLCRFGTRGRHIGAPVYHLHEPLDHAARLAQEWPRICLGSSGDYAVVGTSSWQARMREVMAAVCDSQGRPYCKLHGLRMLNPKVFTQYPFASADSTNIARNIGIDKAWRGTYVPSSKSIKGLVMAERIESHAAPSTFSEIACADLL